MRCERGLLLHNQLRFNENHSRTLLYNSPVSLWYRRFLPLLLWSAVAMAQTAGKTQLSYKLLSIHVKGLERFTERDVVSASGLRLGQFAGEEEFKQAAQKLGETGLFTQLNYSYKYSAGGCDLELQVAENDHLVPILFDNFVWFSDDELLHMLHDRVPLFDGRVPEGGHLTDQIADALGSILDEHKIAGRVEYMAAGPLNGGIESYDYKLSMRAIVIRDVDFPGAAETETPFLQAAAQPLSGQDYLRTKMRVQEKFNFLPVYHARGYLKAEFADAQAKVAQDGAQTLVDVSFPVNPGVRYKLTDIKFAGNSVFPAEKLRGLIHLKTGEPANSVELADDLQQIHKLYGTKGYLFAHADANPSMDDAAATVAYQLNVTEDEMYRMGDLNIDGIPEENSKKMLAQWQMKRGDPYDSSYPQRFFSIMYRDFGLHGSYDVVPKEAIDRQQKVVNVALHFVPKS
jgi:outer membrane protein assembly factor BamA